MGNAVRRLGIVVVVLSANTASAVFTPNPAGRWEQHRFHLAVDGHYLKKDIIRPQTRQEYDIYGFFLRPSFSIAPNVTVYGRLGFQESNQTELGVAGGGGMQAAYPIPAAPEWAVGVSFDFLYVAESDLDDPRDPQDFPGSEQSREWMEYQIAAGISYDVPRVRGLTPYAALLVDFVDIDRFDVDGDSAGGLHEDDLFGFAVGFNIDPRPNWRIDLQFRAISETAASLSVGYTF